MLGTESVEESQKLKKLQIDSSEESDKDEEHKVDIVKIAFSGDQVLHRYF